MTNIAAQIAFDSDSIPVHIEPDRDSAHSLPYLSLSSPIFYGDNEGVIAIKGKPTFAGSRNDASLPRDLLTAYRARGVGIFGELRGPFALVIVEYSARKCLIAIDRMGVERLTWGRRKGWTVVGSSAAEVAQCLTSDPGLNNQALFNFMYSHMIPAPGTVFRDVYKLLPGTAIEFSENCQREFRYWQPNFNRQGDADISQLLKDTRPILRKAIERTSPEQSSGAFLSGGLDSSTISGLLSEVQTHQTPVFSVGFGVAEYDEMEFAREAAEKFHLAHHVYEVTPDDIVELIPKIAAAYDEPFGNSSAVPTFCCARFALSHGIDHLLAGDAGDELFGGNERYVRHRIFEWYNRVPMWLRNSVFGPFAKRTDPENGVYPLRKISSYIRQAAIPLPERFESWNLIYREGAERIFNGEFLKTVEPAQVFSEMRTVWQSCPTDDLLDRMLWYDWKVTLADNDLRKVSQMCELAGVRVSYPMLDEDFVEHSTKIPSNAKISGYELRTFFKNSVRGFLPDKILDKEKHGFGLPFGVWLKTDRPLQDLVYGSLDSLRQRDIFELSFLDRVTAEHKSGHASYYGYAIWDLVMLEQWFQHHIAP